MDITTKQLESKTVAASKGGASKEGPLAQPTSFLEKYLAGH